MDINIGDIIEMKKNHPCGSNTFLVKRTGMDIGIKCTLCGHYTLVRRNKLIKNIKNIKKKEC